MAVMLPFFVATYSSGCSRRSGVRTVGGISAPFNTNVLAFRVSPSARLGSLGRVSGDYTLLFLRSSNGGALRSLVGGPTLVGRFFDKSNGTSNVLGISGCVTVPKRRVALRVSEDRNTGCIKIVTKCCPFPKGRRVLLLSVPISIIRRN